jgi:hypothetical protein
MMALFAALARRVVGSRSGGLGGRRRGYCTRTLAPDGVGCHVFSISWVVASRQATRLAIDASHHLLEWAVGVDRDVMIGAVAPLIWPGAPTGFQAPQCVSKIV